LEHAMLFHGNLGPGEAGPPPGIAGLIARVERTRGFGDFLQHMLVAEGAGEIAIDPVMQPWDIAAPQVIVEEAGGRATGLGGERAFYWASRLDPTRAEPLYARWVAYWMRLPGWFEEYVEERPRVLESPNVAQVDSLYQQALFRNPLTPRTLHILLYDQLPGRGARRLAAGAARKPRVLSRPRCSRRCRAG